MIHCASLLTAEGNTGAVCGATKQPGPQPTPSHISIIWVELGIIVFIPLQAAASGLSVDAVIVVDTPCAP